MKLNELRLQFQSGITAEYVRDSLLQHHLFPAIKSLHDEVPPVFTSKDLTGEVAEELFLLSPKNGKRPVEQCFESFAPMRFTALKFNGAIRSMQVPHPVPYARLVHHIYTNWSEIEKRLQSENSRIKPEKIDDGRLFSMNYGSPELQAEDEARNYLGTTHIAIVDISNFFPSIYTHAIDWAIRTKAACKKNVANSTEWSHQLDSRLRDMQERESIGVAIGPGTSNLMAEIILQQIDKELQDANFKFVRFIDDYTCYAESKSQALDFVLTLNQKLYDFRLALNHRKTRIVEVSNHELDGWIEEIRTVELQPDDNKITMIRKLRVLESLSNRYPDHSVLNFGLGGLLRRSSDFTDDQIANIAPELARVMWVNPSTVSRVVKIVSPRVRNYGAAKDLFKDSLVKLIEAATDRREADSVLWGLYGIRKMNYKCSEKYLEAVTDWCPLNGAAALAMFPNRSRQFLTRSMQALPFDSDSILDENWLLRYELWRLGDLKDLELSQARETGYFKVLADHDVKFLTYEH